MPKCELTGIAQIAVQKCLHEKCNGKYVGYLTCKYGMKKIEGKFINTGACPNFIEGASAGECWCRLWEENKYAKPEGKDRVRNIDT